MKLWIIAIIAGVLLIGGVFAVNTFSGKSVTKISSCSSCGNGCTADNNCGSASCGAVNGGSCNCNSSSGCGSCNGSCDGKCGLSGCSATNSATKTCGCSK